MTATFEELLDFANKVRAAGGGELIESLMPGLPGSPSRCLIARNLNFSCKVQGISSSLWDSLPDRLKGESYIDTWSMMVEPFELGEKIATALDLPFMRRGRYDALDRAEIVLPVHIGNAAADFDRARRIEKCIDRGEAVLESDRALLERMKPYFEDENAYA